MRRRYGRRGRQRVELTDAIALYWPSPDTDPGAQVIKVGEYSVEDGELLTPSPMIIDVGQPSLRILPAGVSLAGTFDVCAQNITFTPLTNIPTLQPGDLVIYVGTFGVLGAGTVPVPVPAGWEPLVLAYVNSNDNEAIHESAAYHSIYYRFYQFGDAPSSFNHNSASANHCARFIALRGVNPDVPFDYLKVVYPYISGGTLQTTGFVFPAPRVIPETVVPTGVLGFGYYRRATSATDRLIQTPRGRALDFEQHRSTVSGTDTVRTILWFRRAANGELQNVMPDQDGINALTGWTAIASTITYVTTSRQAATQLQATAVSTRHYASRTIPLVAGQRYSWTVIGSTGSGSNGIALSVVRPDAVEFGQIFEWTGSPGMSLGTVIGAGFDEVYNTRSSDLDGAGSAGHQTMTCVFVAPTTGNYEFRINLTSSGALTHANALSVRLIAQYLGLGYYIGPFAVTGQSNSKGLAEQTAYPTTRTAVGNDWNLNRPASYVWAVLPEEIGPPPARMQVTEGDDTLTTAFLTNDDMTIASIRASENNTYSFQADRWVPPRIGSTPGRYYAEYRIDTIVGTPNLSYRIGVRIPTGGYQGDSNVINPNNGFYAIAFTGAIYQENNPIVTGAALVQGDIVGIAIDFANKTVAFYVNGVLRGTCAMNQTKLHDRSYMCVKATVDVGSTVTLYTANLRGPFDGRKPPGFVAYDYRYEVS